MSVKYVCVHVCECAWRARMCVWGAVKCVCGMCVYACVYGREMYVWSVCVCVCVRQGNVCVCTKRVHVHGGETKRGSAQNSTANDPILRCIID